MAVNLISQSAYARHRGCDEKAVRKAIAAGRISLIDGKIDPVVADIQWAANTRAYTQTHKRASGALAAPQALAQPGNAPDGADLRLAVGDSLPVSAQQPLLGPTPDAPRAPASATAAATAIAPSYADHRARREAADAERAELETARLAGRLVDRERVEAAVFDAFRALRDRVLAVPRRCAPALLGVVEVREIELAIADELRRALGTDDDATVAAIQTKVTAP